MRFHLTKRKRRVIGILILGAAVGLSAYLIIKPASAEPQVTGISIATSTGGAKLDPSLVFQSNPLENLTLDFANKVFQNAINNNLYQTSGPASILPPNTSDIQKTISQIVDNEYATEVVTSSDITVGTDDSKAAQILYLLYINQVVSDIPTFSGTSTPSTDLPTSFTTAAQNFDTAVQLLEMVKIPPSWVSVQKDVLTLLIHQRNVFQSLAKANNDPVRFMIALYQGGSNQFDAVFSEIQNEINQKIQDEKLI